MHDEPAQRQAPTQKGDRHSGSTDGAPRRLSSFGLYLLSALLCVLCLQPMASCFPDDGQGPVVIIEAPGDTSEPPRERTTTGEIPPREPQQEPPISIDRPADSPADGQRDNLGDDPTDGSPGEPDSQPLEQREPVKELSASQDAAPEAQPEPTPETTSRCPTGMVYIPFVDPVTKQSMPFCIDQWEISIVETIGGKSTGNAYSPYYPPSRQEAEKRYAEWEVLRKTMGSQQARSIPLPALPAWLKNETPQSLPTATSVSNAIPHGYLTGTWAQQVCQNAGKRLCSRKEWVFACKGPNNHTYPYGDGKTYQQGQCNVYRFDHPAVILHDSASKGHLDPRLNAIDDRNGTPFLYRTGATKTCVTRWPDGELYDMVGNLDEWTSDRNGSLGTFVGGFYSRITKRGCDSVISGHAFAYSDYSLGARCCASPK